MRYQIFAVVCGIGLFQLVPRMPDPLLYLSVIPLGYPYCVGTHPVTRLAPRRAHRIGIFVGDVVR